MQELSFFSECLLSEQELYVDEKREEVRQAGTPSPGEIVKGFKETCERSLYVFAKHVLKRERLTPSLSQEICNLLQAVPPLKRLILIPRRHYKTTIACESLPLHVAIQPKERNLYRPSPDLNPLAPSLFREKKLGADYRILIVRETKDLAIKTMGFLQRELERNKLLRTLWPHIRWENPRKQGVRPWNTEALLLPRTENYLEPTFSAAGVDTSITGSGFDIHLLDDLLTERRAASAADTQRSIDFWTAARALYDDVSTLLSLTIGTKWPSPDLYTFIQNQNPTRVDGSPDVDHPDYVHVYRRAVVENDAPIMPERVTMEDVEALKKHFGSLFYFIFMNSEQSAETNLIDVTNLREYRIEGNEIFIEPTELDVLLGTRVGAEETRKLSSTLQIFKMIKDDPRIRISMN